MSTNHCSTQHIHALYVGISRKLFFTLLRFLVARLSRTSRLFVADSFLVNDLPVASLRKCLLSTSFPITTCLLIASLGASSLLVASRLFSTNLRRSLPSSSILLRSSTFLGTSLLVGGCLLRRDLIGGGSLLRGSNSLNQRSCCFLEDGSKLTEETSFTFSCV